MLCEMCQQREATVHVTGSTRQSSISGADRTFEHHLCETCASTSPLLKPAHKYGPDVIRERLRVISVSPECTRVRLVRTETGAVPEEWSFVTSRLPPHYAVVGMEFGVTCSHDELEHLKGNR